MARSHRHPYVPERLTIKQASALTRDKWSLLKDTAVDLQVTPGTGVLSILVTDKAGYGFKIAIRGAGKVGLGAEISALGYGAPVTMFPEGSGAIDTKYSEICVYRNDEWAQAFKRWYTDPEHNEYPGGNGDDTDAE